MNTQISLTSYVSTRPLTEAHRLPGTRETCTTELVLDLVTMTATCPTCGAAWGVVEVRRNEDMLTLAEGFSGSGGVKIGAIAADLPLDMA